MNYSPLFPAPDAEKVIVATDGSCLKNPGGPSGWAWYADDNCWAAGPIFSGTNQQAELMAILCALADIPVHIPLIIHTDSQYAHKSITLWMKAWKAHGWKKQDGTSIANIELMQGIDAAIQARTAYFSIQWVRGHNGDHRNENADYRCNNAAHAVAKDQPVEEGPGWGKGPTGVITLPPKRPTPAAKPVQRRRPPKRK